MLTGKPEIVTEETMKMPWSGYRDGRRFRCDLCGVFFHVGDTFRFVLMQGVKRAHQGNLLVCVGCDGDDVIDRACDNYEIAITKYWWMRDRERSPTEAQLKKTLSRHPDE